MPDRSAISSSECSPSERFSTQRRALISAPIGFPAGRAVEISLPELRFAIRIQIAIPPIVFQHIQDGGAHAKRFGQLQRLNEIEIVGRSVILRERFPRHCASGNPPGD